MKFFGDDQKYVFHPAIFDRPFFMFCCFSYMAICPKILNETTLFVYKIPSDPVKKILIDKFMCFYSTQICHWVNQTSVKNSSETKLYNALSLIPLKIKKSLAAISCRPNYATD